MACDGASRHRWRAISALLLALVLVQADATPPIEALQRFALTRVAPLAMQLAHDPEGSIGRARDAIGTAAGRGLLAAHRALQQQAERLRPSG